MKNYSIYGSVGLVLLVSLYLNVHYARQVDTLQKQVGLQQVNDFPFLHKMTNTVNDQFLWEGTPAGLKDMPADKPCLCILYLSTMCETCVQESLFDLSELKKSVPEENLAVITDYTGKRDLLILRNKLGKTVRLLNLSDVAIGKEPAGLAALNSPLLFMWDKDRKMKSVLLFIPEIPAYNRAYYRTLKKLYFK